MEGLPSESQFPHPGSSYLHSPSASHAAASDRVTGSWSRSRSLCPVAGHSRCRLTGAILGAWEHARGEPCRQGWLVISVRRVACREYYIEIDSGVGKLFAAKKQTKQWRQV